MEHLLQNIERLHTTPLGEVRIKRNLSLATDDVVAWCKTKILSDGVAAQRMGKNYYVSDNTCVITIHANSYTIITAHRK